VRIAIDYDLERSDLLPALLALSWRELLDDPLEKALADRRQSREPIPETWLAELIGEFSRVGKATDDRMIANLHKLTLATLAEPIAKAERPSRISGMLPGRKRPSNVMLTQGQLDELVMLVRQHYRATIRAGGVAPWGIDAAMEKRWRALGIVRPDVDLSALVGDAFVAGRMSQILDDGMSLADMRRMAREFPLSRESALTMRAVQERVDFDLSGGMGYRTELQAGRLIQGRNADNVRQIVAAYRSGELRRTPTNRQGFTPQELDAAATGKAVEGWRGLARELRNRMAGEDRTRDWERVAASSLRMTANIGAIDAMAEAGVTELWYDVHPRACEHCKALYLDEKGEPIIFSVAEIMDNITATGGANYDRKASAIGDREAGWLPTGVAHPWCMCRPKRRIKNVAPAGRIQAAEASKRS
jgi:hypothetical protein